MFVWWGLRALSKQPSQHTHMSEALQVGFWLIPLMVQISHKLWLDSRNFCSERKLPGGLKPVCPTLPNFLWRYCRMRQRGHGQCCHRLVVRGYWQLPGDSRSLESPWATLSCTRAPRPRVSYRGTEVVTSPLSSLNSARSVICASFAMIILTIFEKLRYWFTKAE